MNKKILFGAALIGLAGFASCVDDTESASVTAVRQAKAEQLKAMADLDKANAEAALILANASKAAQEAQAAYNNAQAEYMKAQAAYYNAKTEWEKEQAAIALEQSKLALQQAQAELQATLARLDADVARYKYEAAKYQQDYDKLIANVEKEKAAELQQLLDNYNRASKTLITLKRDLARQTSNLAKQEANLVSISEGINDQITDLEDENAELQLDINAQNAIIATYEKYAGTTVTEDQVNDAHVKMVELQVAAAEASDKYNEAYESKNDAQQQLYAYQSEIYNNWLNGNKDLSYSEYNEVTERWDYHYVSIQRVWSNSAPAAARNKYCLVIEQRNNQISYLPLFDVDVRETTEIDYELSNGEETYPYDTYKSFFNLIDGGKALETLISYKEKQISQWSNPDIIEDLKKKIPELQKAKDEAQSAFNEAAKDYDTAKGAYETAEEAYNAAAESADKAWQAYYDNTDADKAAELLKAAQDASKTRDEAYDSYSEARNKMDDARYEKQAALYALDNATNELNIAQGDLNTQEANVEQLTEELASFKEEVATLIGMGATNEDNLKAYNTAAKTEAEAYVAYLKAQDANNIQSSEYWTLYQAYYWNNGMVGGNGEANNKISNAKNEIENLTAQIEANQKLIDGYKNDLADIEAGNYDPAEMQKELIADIKAEIEKLNVEIATAQQKYDIAKAELEAAVKAE